ncbi:hypothetical protein HDU76_012196, partial [Blyttiomyces sp. JEL0837]
MFVLAPDDEGYSDSEIDGQERFRAKHPQEDPAMDRMYENSRSQLQYDDPQGPSVLSRLSKGKEEVLMPPQINNHNFDLRLALSSRLGRAPSVPTDSHEQGQGDPAANKTTGNTGSAIDAEVLQNKDRGDVPLNSLPRGRSEPSLERAVELSRANEPPRSSQDRQSDYQRPQDRRYDRYVPSPSEPARRYDHYEPSRDVSGNSSSAVRSGEYLSQANRPPGYQTSRDPSREPRQRRRSFDE